MPLIKVDGKWVNQPANATTSTAPETSQAIVPFIPTTLDDVAAREKKLMQLQVQQGQLTIEEIPADNDDAAYMAYAEETLIPGLQQICEIDAISQEVMDKASQLYGIPLGIRKLLLDQCSKKNFWHIGLDDSLSMCEKTALQHSLLTEVEQYLLTFDKSYNSSSSLSSIKRSHEQNMIVKALVDLIMSFTPNSKQTQTTIAILPLSKAYHNQEPINITWQTYVTSDQKINAIASHFQSLNFSPCLGSTPVEAILKKIPLSNPNSTCSILFTDGEPTGNWGITQIQNFYNQPEVQAMSTTFQIIGDDDNAKWTQVRDKDPAKLHLAISFDLKLLVFASSVMYFENVHKSNMQLKHKAY